MCIMKLAQQYRHFNVENAHTGISNFKNILGVTPGPPLKGEGKRVFRTEGIEWKEKLEEGVSVRRKDGTCASIPSF